MKKPQALIGLLAALGTAIGVLIAVVGLPYGRADYTAFAELYHGTENTAGQVHVAIDCNTATTATESACFINLPAPATTNVDVTVGNETGANIILGTFNLTVVHTDGTRLNAQISGGGPLDSNPDFTADTTALGDWSCGPPNPSGDLDANPANGDESFISCFNALASGPTIPDDNPDDTVPHNDLARVTYDIPGTVTAGTVPLSLKEVAVADDSLTEVGSCNAPVTIPMPCFGASITFQVAPTNTPVPPGPTNTPTNTATATNTPGPTNTPTATFTPLSDSGIIKHCEGGVELPNGEACNLWICEPDMNPVNDPDCDGPGEGSLHVIEEAVNVPPTTPGGLGAYEFSVEYDNFVIQSVNPCDIVFGPTGMGAARGPVDELDSSSPANADCTPDPNSILDGSCAMSLVLENIIHFGCVTAGPTPPNGPTGTFDLASLELVPHPDLNNDLFPGNNNGVLTVIKDNGCELVDAFGHPIPGSINGGLSILCRDLAVTVRILEGDVDLDCDVDTTDAQAIAAHYGAFFGGLLYSKWLDLEPQFHDLDIDIKDVQKVFGRQGSTCQNPIPAQPPLNPFTPFQD